ALDKIAVSGPEYLDYRDQSKLIDGIAAYAFGDTNLSSGGTAERVTAGVVTASFLPLFGSQPALGRNFTDENQKPGQDQVALLSHGLWQRRFGGEPSVLG